MTTRGLALVLAMIATTAAGATTARAAPWPKLIAIHVTMPAGATATMLVIVPSSFAASAFGAIEKTELGYGDAGVGFQITCDGDCSAGKLPGQLAKLVAHAPDADKIPNLNTGDPKLDAVRLDAVTLDHGDIPGGKFVVYRITKPAGLDGPYQEQFKAVCARLDPKQERFVVAQVWTSLAEETELGPQLVAACKSFTIASD
jgi:hypothetical protein|nr:hypothetical protein [Kofleriaceae bacterium]